MARVGGPCEARRHCSRRRGGARGGARPRRGRGCRRRECASGGRIVTPGASARVGRAGHACSHRHCGPGAPGRRGDEVRGAATRGGTVEAPHQRDLPADRTRAGRCRPGRFSDALAAARLARAGGRAAARARDVNAAFGAGAAPSPPRRADRARSPRGSPRSEHRSLAREGGGRLSIPHERALARHRRRPVCGDGFPHLRGALVRVAVRHPRRAGQRDLLALSRIRAHAGRAARRHSPRRLRPREAAATACGLARATVGKARRHADHERGPRADRRRPPGSARRIRLFARSTGEGAARGGRLLVTAKLLIGLDVGTTSARAVAVDLAGHVLATASAEYPLSTPRPGWAEQDPDLWWAASRQVLSTITKKLDEPPSAIGLTGQMHGSVFLDEHDRVIRPALLWNDQRTARQCQTITERIGADRLKEITGNPAITGFQAPKILWLRENEPDAYARVRHVLLPKDFIRLQLAGEFATDASDASGTLLLDLRRRAWSDDVLA